MTKLKIVELVLVAASALINAARLAVKFISYLGKLLKQRQGYAAA